jgi:hypothetical protein
MHGVSTKMIDGTNLDDDQAEESTVVLIVRNIEASVFVT